MIDSFHALERNSDCTSVCMVDNISRIVPLDNLKKKRCKYCTVISMAGIGLLAITTQKLLLYSYKGSRNANI